MQINHLESRSKFAPGYKFLKHRSRGQKYTLGANCAHEHGLNLPKGMKLLKSCTLIDDMSLFMILFYFYHLLHCLFAFVAMSASGFHGLITGNVEIDNSDIMLQFQMRSRFKF